ncbi:MAG TPA: TatD family nuclease-associated radical SAM protein [Candidatus Wallbacteria bacterium]|nr:TatD family nuclease-associated radical SAM protein [Candidatus Wallbacteria bacterium]
MSRPGEALEKITPVYAYKIKNAVYINTTSSCSNVCEFCIKFFARGVDGYDLVLSKDPEINETVNQIQCLATPEVSSIVFCGLGESTYRLDFMEKIAAIYKAKGFKIRLNTNGHGNIINKCDIVPRLAAFLDSISISLNAQNKDLYDKMCNPAYDDAYEAMIDFSKKCVGKIPEVWLTIIDMPGIDKDACRKIAEDIGAKFRVRPYIPDKRKKCENENCQ